MKKILLVLATIIIGVISTNAQSNGPSLSLDDLSWYGKIYTDAEIKAVLGEPTKTISWTDEMGVGREYEYNRDGTKYDLIRYCDTFGITFALATPTFSLYNGKLRVGIPINDVKAIGGLLIKSDKESGVYSYYHSGVRTDYYIKLIVDSQQKIKSVSLVTPSA